MKRDKELNENRLRLQEQFDEELDRLRTQQRADYEAQRDASEAKIAELEK
jgi:hypothetical protein